MESLLRTSRFMSHQIPSVSRVYIGGYVGRALRAASRSQHHRCPPGNNRRHTRSAHPHLPPITRGRR